MTWTIFNKPANATVHNLDFLVEPANDIMRSVIADIFVYRFPEVVYNLANNSGHYQEFLAINLYSEMDWEDKARARGIQEDEVQLYHECDGSTLVKEESFYRFIYDYASELLIVYHDQVEIQADYTRWLTWRQAPNDGLRQYYLHYNNNWAIAMVEGLHLLKQKINSRWS